MSTTSATDGESDKPGLRVELFVSDVPRSAAFYGDVLGFDVIRAAPGSYTSLARDGAVIGLNDRASLPQGHPTRPEPDQALGRGVELVVMVKDVVAAYTQAAANAEVSDLVLQPWGLTDFRVVDPDGYYIRVTSLATAPLSRPSRSP